MEIFLILLLAIFIVPLCYLKGIKKGIDSVTWDLYINKKLSEEDISKYKEDTYIMTTSIK